MTEKNNEREAFEAWMRRDKPDMPLYRRDMAGSERFGQYCSMLIEDQWQAWQARAALQAGGQPVAFNERASVWKVQNPETGYVWFTEAREQALQEARSGKTVTGFGGALAAPAPVASPAALTDAVDRTIKTIERQLELIAERAPGNFLDKRPVVQSLTAHAKRLRAALLAAQPAEDALEAERTQMNSLFKRQPDETIEQHQERFKVGVDALQAAEPAPAPAAQADDWPMPYVDGPKQFEVMKSDPSNSHSPWLLRMPGTSACLLFNHEADDAIDEARCKWIAAACNAVRQQSAALAGPARADRQGVALSELAMNHDDYWVEQFAVAMKRKLAAARAKGRSGWQHCDPADLSRMLREHVEKGDPRDVANFCMFLYALGHGIQVAPRDWRINVAGPGGYERFETFKGETLEGALRSVSQQGFSPVPDEDGFVTMKVKV